MHHCDENVATYTIYSNTPFVDYGSTCTQLFVDTNSLVSYVYGMKTDKQLVNTLEENICACGAMSKLVSGCD